MEQPARRRFQRARRDSEKATRRQAILAAAAAHLRADGFEAFSMNALAQAAGIAKGTLYLYFETREEVLLSLHAEQLAAWCEAVTRATRRGMSDATFVRRFLETAQADPLFLDLAGRLGSVLEHNVSVERLIESKRRMRELLLPLAGHFERCLGLGAGAGVEVLRSFAALVIGASQLDAGPSLEGEGAPTEVAETIALFSCRSVFPAAAQLVLAGIRGGAKVS